MEDKIISANTRGFSKNQDKIQRLVDHHRPLSFVANEHKQEDLSKVMRGKMASDISDHQPIMLELPAGRKSAPAAGSGRKSSTGAGAGSRSFGGKTSTGSGRSGGGSRSGYTDARLAKEMDMLKIW